MAESKHRISNWPKYNSASTNRDSPTLWIDKQAINRSYRTEHHGGRGRGFQFSDTAIATALMLKGLFNLPLQAQEGFINSIWVY